MLSIMNKVDSYVTSAMSFVWDAKLVFPIIDIRARFMISYLIWVLELKKTIFYVSKFCSNFSSYFGFRIIVNWTVRYWLGIYIFIYGDNLDPWFSWSKMHRLDSFKTGIQIKSEHYDLPIIFMLLMVPCLDSNCIMDIVDN